MKGRQRPSAVDMGEIFISLTVSLVFPLEGGNTLFLGTLVGRTVGDFSVFSPLFSPMRAAIDTVIIHMNFVGRWNMSCVQCHKFHNGGTELCITNYYVADTYVLLFLMNVPLLYSSNAILSSSCVFITMGPYQAIGSPMGLPDMTLIFVPLSNTTSGIFVLNISR